jgi:tetratricopeptide (TPR) repeat protein
MDPMTLDRRRRGPRAAGVALAALAVVAATYLAAGLRPATGTVHPAGPAPEPSIAGPALDAGSVPGASLAQIDHSIEAWSRNLVANPQDYLAATNLAVLYQGRGRLSYDLADLERSLDAARQALSIDPGNLEARLAEGSILLSMHDFDGALTVAEAILFDAPGQPAAVALRFDAEVELGRIVDARRDLVVLEPVGGPAVLIREARLASVTGDPARALDLAIAAREAALEEDVRDAGLYQYAVGEYARLAGDATTARSAFAAAIEIRPTDVGALLGLARIDAFDGSTADAIDGLRRATSIAPQPEALGLVGDLLRASDPRDAEAGKAFETIRFIERLGDIQATTYDRQLLRFEIDHDGVDDAILARVSASVTARRDAAGHDLRAWALYRLGRYADASREVQAARALGADDARLRFHDGAIRLALGDLDTARALLQSAVALGPALDPAERAEVARLLPA